MRLTTSGVLGRVDLGPAARLIPALLDEWAKLQFDRSGLVINPVSGSAMPSLSLVDGRHREPGSRYLITVDATKPDGLESRRELRVASVRRRRPQPAHVSPEPSVTVVVVREDDADHLAVTISDEHTRWTVDVDMRHGPLPRFDLTGQADLTTMIRDGGTPGCFSRGLGGRGWGRASVDLSVLEHRGGSLIDAEGRVSRFRGDGRANVETSALEWRVKAAVRLKARGLGRLVLLFAGRRIKRGFDDGLARFWQMSGEGASQLRIQLLELARMVDDEGGEAAFVHRALWDPDFDPTPPTTRG